MKAIVKTKYGYNPSDHTYKVDPKSDTVPDQNLSIREILQRFSRGLPPPGSIHPGDFDDPALDDMNILDRMPDEFMEIHPSIRQDQDLTDLDNLRDEYFERREDHYQTLKARKQRSSDVEQPTTSKDKEG